MEEIIIEKLDDIKQFVEKMSVNTRYVLPNNFRYKWIKIEKDNDYFTKETYFSWSMK